MRVVTFEFLGAAVALGLAVGCTDNTRTDERVRYLADDDGDGVMSEVDPADGSGIMYPDPGDCPLLQWTEIHTVVTDADGNVVSETYQVCTQCLDEAGNPIGDETCYDEPPLPPDVYCEEYDSGDPATTCYRCIAADGTIVEDSCYTAPAACAADADCPEGQVCYIYDSTGMGSMGDPSGGTDRDGDGIPDDGGGTGDATGYCGYPDPCVATDGLPSDPTGESCWVCTDPTTGEEYASWCDVHRCGDDGSCTNEWEVCDATSGYCVYDDPCDPVDSRPDDPTGESCWTCSDPMSGEDWGWCDLHRCADDGSCAPGEICDAGSGYCVYDDPCEPVDSLPDDPTGSDCYVCTDPATGEDWGGYCNTHRCETDDDCYALGMMCGCDEASGTCIFD